MEYFEHHNTPATTSHVTMAQAYLWQVWLVYFGPSAAGTSCEEFVLQARGRQQRFGQVHLRQIHLSLTVDIHSLTSLHFHHVLRPLELAGGPAYRYAPVR